MTDSYGEIPRIFDSYNPVQITEDSVGRLDVLRAQTGLSEKEAVKLVLDIGVDVVGLLIRAAANQEIEPVLDIAIRQVDDMDVESISVLPLIIRATQTLTGLVESAKDRSA